MQTQYDIVLWSETNQFDLLFDLNSPYPIVECVKEYGSTEIKNLTYKIN